MSSYVMSVLGDIIEYAINKKDYSSDEIVRTINKEIEYMDSGLIDTFGKNWENLTVNMAKEFGFLPWTDDESVDEEIESINNDDTLDSDDKGHKIILANNTRNLYLIPLYLYHLIPNGLKVYSIFGEEIIVDTVNHNLDNDSRFGVLAYGIKFDNTNDSEEDETTDNFKRVFISQPMRDKTDEQIKAERQRAEELIRQQVGDNFIVIDSFFEGVPHDATPLWYLSKSFELLSTADIAYFVKGWDEYRGCKLEHTAAKEYGIEIIEES